jgi:hypothetical protein
MVRYDGPIVAVRFLSSNRNSRLLEFCLCALKTGRCQISNRNKNGFLPLSVFRDERKIGAVRVHDLLAFERQVTALGDK